MRAYDVPGTVLDSKGRAKKETEMPAWSLYYSEQGKEDRRMVLVSCSLM
jgi:hypothetical protein